MDTPDKAAFTAASPWRDYMRAGLAGGIVAAVGAFGWVKLTAVAGKPYGVVAVLIGLLTGMAARWGMKRSDIAAGVLAGVFTLSALLAAWYFIVFDYLLNIARANKYTGVQGLSLLEAMQYMKGWDWLFVAMSVYLAARTAGSSSSSMSKPSPSSS